MPDPTQLFGGTPGQLVPPVDPDDLKSAFEISQEAANRHPGGGVATSLELFQHACKPGADVHSVTHRAMMLGVLVHLAGEQLAPWMKDGQLDSAVFREAAQLPLEWMGIGKMRPGPPVDVEAFFKKLRSEGTEI